MHLGAVQRGGGQGDGPPVKILAPVPPMKFMIKHNLPLVRGGSLWQYRSVPPICNYDHPTGLPKCKPQNRHCLHYVSILSAAVLRLWLYRFTCGLIYYALAFNTGTLHGDVYLNTFVSGALEIPAYLISIVIMNWRLTGRRWTGCLAFFCAGMASVACIPTAYLG